MRQRTKRRQQQILAATLDENYITIYHPGKYSGGVDWDDSGWYAYFKTEAETDSE